MSSYITFFLKTKNNEFIELGSFGRSCYIYQVVNAPYEKIRKITMSDFRDFISNISVRIINDKENIESYKEKQAFVAKFENNSIQEKLEAIEEYDSCINDTLVDIEDLTFASNYFDVYSDILQNSQLEIYAGVDISNPTIEDITV